MRYGSLVAFALFAAGQMHASTISSFTFSPTSAASESPFATSLTESFTSSEATLAGTITCDSTKPCSGEVGTFSLGLDLTTPTSFSITSLGSLTGETAATGSVVITSPFSHTRGFTIPTGSFDHTRITGLLPALGVIDVTGTLDLSLQPGQTLTLPVTVAIDGAAVPEPIGQVFLVLLSGLGLAGFVRYRSSRRVS